MKKLILSAAILAAVALSSCVGATSPLAGLVYTDVESGVAVTGNSLGTKVGRAMGKGIICFATGDVSIQTAARSAGIKRISHVDQHSMSVLGLYSTYEIIVYGE